MEMDPTCDCHAALVELAQILRARILALRAKEQKSGTIIVKLSLLIRQCADILLCIQEIRFDLGLDEYKRGMTKEGIAEAAMRERRTQQEVYDASVEMAEAFRKRGVALQHYDVPTDEDKDDDNLSGK